MAYQIFFTHSAASTLSNQPSFLQPFLQTIQAELSTNATIETALRKPLQNHPDSPWLFCFGKDGVLYQIEGGNRVKVFLLLTSKRPEGFSEADGPELVQASSAAMAQIAPYRDEPISLSLEAIARQWLPQPAPPSKAKLDLVVECGAAEAAQQLCQRFAGMALTLVDQAQYRCRAEVFQDAEQSWWCWVRPISSSTLPKNRFQTKELQRLLYHHLQSAPDFRYALCAVGAYDWACSSGAPTTTPHSSILQGQIPPIAYCEGLVLSEAVWRAMSAPPQLVEPFTQGYVWIPPRSPQVLSAADFKPMLDPAPQSAEEYYNNGSILGHQGKHREALTAFDMALLLDPTLHLAAIGRKTALRFLSR